MSSMSSQLNTRSNLRFLLGLGLALSLGAFALIVGNGSAPLSPAAFTVGQHDGPGVAGIGPALAGGTDVTLAQARNMTRLPMVLPETSLASDSDVTDVWVRTEGSDYVTVEYRSGVSVEIRPWPVAEITPEEHWRDLMEEGIPGRIINVGGQNVFVVPSSETAKGSVAFVANQTFVSIIGNGGQTENDLVALMRSATSSDQPG